MTGYVVRFECNCKRVVGQSKHFVEENFGRLRAGVLRDRQWEACGLHLLVYFAVNSKPVIWIYDVASMVIPCRVDN